AATCITRMATTATTTAPSTEADHDVFALLCDLTRLQLTWSFEGTVDAEATVRRVAARYGAQIDVTVLADAAGPTGRGAAVSCSRAPIVPPLDQVTDLKRLFDEIDAGTVSAREADRRLTALEQRPPHFSRTWQVIGLGLFATGFGVSVQATGQEVLASAVL